MDSDDRVAGVGQVMRASAAADRARDTELVAAELSAHAHRLTRYLVKHAGAERLSLTEAGLLHELTSGPRRISELAARQDLAQPTTTILVKRLETDGLVSRVRQDDDHRVVLVSLTTAGREALEQLRVTARGLLRAHLDQLSDEQVRALAAATAAFGELTELIRCDQHTV